ncbi:MAG: zinc-ribbon domain-containing protein, partial [Pseudomonas sp.]
MHRFFEQLSSRIIAPFMGESSRNSKVWPCRCGQSLFFRNSQCLACNALLGYQPEESRITSLSPGVENGTWTLDADPDAGLFRRCANLDTPAACNWLLPANVDDALCVACSLNRTIPDLSDPENPERWRKVEIAKRRLVAQL